MEVRKLSNGVTNALFVNNIRSKAINKHKESKYLVKNDENIESIVPTTKETLKEVKELLMYAHR